ncbi:MAG: UDP-4-amino-4-deoxy-L-arabinose-oxoglutarate aminotransferase [marine bacterium B5-7]|nr:MAG: UDP-4-amino-4-deoxy-L-arabinose-oxoglutarate aminotransferase [marine bacterium B5-7]
MSHPLISIVIPIHNEEEVLEVLYQRLMTTMDNMGKSFEVLFTNDGSRDRSAEILNEMQQRRPKEVRVIHFNGNFGQHMAIMAGFENVRGEIIITLDADCQNPPEEIPKLVELMEKGHDVVGGYRMDRQDKVWRLVVSKCHNIFRKWIAPKIEMKDEGCMLRAYSKRIVELMLSSRESSTFIPALAMLYAQNPAEVGVKHEARELGETSYSFYKLIRYNFDLVTNFSLVPLQMFTFIGVLVSMLSTFFVIYLFIRRLLIGPEAEGVFTLFAIAFFLIGICLMGLGIIGEYIGRIYTEVQGRPRFVIKEIVQSED